MEVNVDIGEGGSNDHIFMPHVSSCSIACGGHYGSFSTIKKTIKLASDHSVKIGSHPSYPDKINFGRKSISINLNDLKKSIRFQLLSFKKALNHFSLPWHHCKAHGALYNDMIKDENLTNAYFQVLKEFPEIEYIILPTGQEIVNTAKSYKYKVLREVFSDRYYNDDLTLISRTKKSSIVNSTSLFLENLNFLLEGKINLSNKLKKEIFFDTICLHTDHEKSIDFIKVLSEKIKKQ
ncbi:MAG: lactam utilization protein LamB [Flavobacteriaceae bacterium]|nr:lactam utilization protein LamB [Flavobacteriaceae bacterium]|tara:strand:- start:1940 stop:2647 length:708 start_codon:yes stop_codon:yes gene_type:complete